MLSHCCTERRVDKESSGQRREICARKAQAEGVLGSIDLSTLIHTSSCIRRFGPCRSPRSDKHGSRNRLCLSHIVPPPTQVDRCRTPRLFETCTPLRFYRGSPHKGLV